MLKTARRTYFIKKDFKILLCLQPVPLLHPLPSQFQAQLAVELTSKQRCCYFGGNRKLRERRGRWLVTEEEMAAVSLALVGP